MSEEHIIEVGGKKYDLVKKGYDQAAQVIQVGKWLTEYGMPVLGTLDIDSEQANSSYLELFAKLFESLEPDALLSLFSVVIGCSMSTAKKEFDIGILIEAITTLWDNQPGIRSVVQRFFSEQSSSKEAEEESSTL
jgi:hypothetical protein